MDRSEKESPLVNGGKETEAREVGTGMAGRELPATPERQPCLPPPTPPPGRPGTRGAPGLDDVDLHRKLSSTNSVAKNRAGFDKAGGRGGRLSAQVETRLRKRTGLTRTGLTVAAVVLALLLIFLIVIVVLACTWPQTPHEHLFPVCTKAACLQASAQMLPKMDVGVAPCDDFWRHACGGWLRAPTPPRARWSLLEQQSLQYKEHLRNLVTTLQFPTDTTSKEWKLQYLYESCMRLDSIESEETRPLEKLIMELGGWVMFRDFSLMAWDSERTIVKMFTTQQITPFFQIDVVPDPRNSSKSIVKILPANLHLPHKSYYYRSPDSSFVPPSGEIWRVHLGQVCVDLTNITSLQSFFKRLNDMNAPSAFMQYLKDVITSFEARSTDAKKFSEDVFFYERRLANAIPDNIDQEDLLASNHRVTIGSLRDSAGQIPLLHILQPMFPKATITNETELLVPSSSFMNTISSIISSTDRRELNKYMMWVLTASYIPYLNSDVRELEIAYNSAITGAPKPLERWEMCITTLEKYMGLALAVLAQRSSPETEKEATRKQVDQMFKNIVDTVKDNIAKAHWMGKDIQNLAIQKVKKMTLQVGVSNSLFSEEYLKRYYEGLHIQRSDFFRNVRNAREFQLSNLDKKLMDPREEYKWMDAASVGKTVKYIPSANKVVVPQWLLYPPFFHAQYPLAVQYGGLGVQIAYAVVSGILPQNILYNADGILLSENYSIINESAKIMKNAKSLIIRDVLRRNITSTEIANQTAHTTVLYTSALRQAHMALLETLTDLPHMHQPAMESYENEQLFFLTYAQNLCSISTPQQMDIDIATSLHLNGSQLLQATLPQLNEFSRAFSCPSTSQHFATNPIVDIL